MKNTIDYIPTGHENAVTREELSRLTGLSDRQVREDIRIASIHGDLILNMQDGKGYFRPSPTKDDAYVISWINMTHNRINEEQRKMRIAERFLKC